MKILRFNDYISLFELELSIHYRKRTSGNNDSRSDRSRIVRFNSDTNKEGFDVDHFIYDGEKIDIEEVEDITGLSEDSIYSYIEKGLRIITRDPFLEKWNPSNGKDYVVIKMGQIYFYSAEQDYLIKVVIKSGNVKNGRLLGFFIPGDTVWGFVRSTKDVDTNNNPIMKLATLKYYDDTQKAIKRIEDDVKDDSAKSDVRFSDNFEFAYPYGKDPKIIIDVDRGVVKLDNKKDDINVPAQNNIKLQ